MSSYRLFLFLLTILLFYWNILSFIVNLRVKTMTYLHHLGLVVLQMSCFTACWRFCGEIQNKSNQNNTLRPMCLAPVLEKAWNSSPGVVCMFFILQLENKHPTGKASEPQEGVCAMNDCAACFVSELVSCSAPGSPKGPRQPGELSEPWAMMSFWVSGLAQCQPFNITLDRAVRGKCVE